MKSGTIPVIGYLLAQPKKDKRNLRSSSKGEKLLTSEEREVSLHCTGKPELKAREITERLVKDRYKIRIEKKQTVEDSMLECKYY